MLRCRGLAFRSRVAKIRQMAKFHCSTPPAPIPYRIETSGPDRNLKVRSEPRDLTGPSRPGRNLAIRRAATGSSGAGAA